MARLGFDGGDDERRARGLVPTSVAEAPAAYLGENLDTSEAALASTRGPSAEMPGAIHVIGHGEALEARLVDALRLTRARFRVLADDKRAPRDPSQPGARIAPRLQLADSVRDDEAETQCAERTGTLDRLSALPDVWRASTIQGQLASIAARAERRLAESPCDAFRAENRP